MLGDLQGAYRSGGRFGAVCLRSVHTRYDIRVREVPQGVTDYLKAGDVGVRRFSHSGNRR